ncbi:MAG TPA: peptide-methionine (R)-S-oxide reductase [Syntrophaceticus sp.]|nr:peptide-methionine (R)-S-oxide reductase [Syntrophaceticus sp.]
MLKRTGLSSGGTSDGESLFSPQDKYGSIDSGCGWPCFTRPLHTESVKEKPDMRYHMIRIEVRNK